MTLKIALGGLSHETNTFQLTDAQLTSFEIERGQTIIDRNQGTRTYLGGMLDAAKEIGATVLPTLSAAATPAGIISEKAYKSLADELLDRLAQAGTVDAVAVALHGAGIAREVGNIEVDICRRVRALVGPATPIVITLDLHANLSPELAEYIDCAFCVHLHPHTDTYERGQDAVRLIPRLMDGSAKPRVHIEKLPFLMTTATTMRGHAAAINDLCRAAEKEAGMITCTYVHGFPYVDSPDSSACVLAVSDGDLAIAKATARRVAQAVWRVRSEIGMKGMAPDEAVRAAVASEQYPVAVLDGGDDPGGGCPGDSTYLLSALIRANVTDTCFAALCDPEVVKQAHKAGVGATIPVELGGKTDDRHGRPIAATAYIKALTDGEFFCQAPMGKGRHIIVGHTARLQIGRIDVVVVSKRYQPIDPEIFLVHGIDVSRYKIVGLKSTNHWRAGFEGIIKHDYLVDSPGLMSRDLKLFAYERVVRPIYPLDEGASYPIAANRP